MVNPGVGGYIKFPNKQKTSKNAKRQPTENQMNTKTEILVK